MLYNHIWGSVLLLCSALGLIILYKAHQHRDKTGVAKWLMLLCVSSALWAADIALMQFLTDYRMVLLAGSPRFALIMASGWLSLFFVLRAMFGYKPPKAALIAVSAFVLLNLVIATVNPGNILYTYHEDFIYRSGMRTFTAEFGPWFFVHSTVSYAPIAVGLGILVWQFVRLPRRHKGMAALMLLSILILITTSLLTMFQIPGLPVDLTPAVSNLTCALFYYALFHTGAMDIIAASREAFFENTKSIIFVLDPQENIVDYNRQAGALLGSLGIEKPIKMPVEKVISCWKALRKGRVHDADPSIMSAYTDDVEEHFYFQKAGFSNSFSENLGSYLEIQNITSIMSTLRLLQDYAFYDSLTGLPNRNYFTEKIAVKGAFLQYPACVWVGDVNLLKRINDAYGHAKGDDLLVRIARILRECAPRNAMIIRMGGDEFVGFFPNSTEVACLEYFQQVDRACEQELTGEFGSINLAMGCQVMTDATQDIHQMLNEADAKMYRNKQFDRRRSALLGERFTERQVHHEEE